MTGAEDGDYLDRGVVPAVCFGVAGAAMFNLAPLYLQANGAHFQLDDRQIGWLMGIEIAGIALACLMVFFQQHRFPVHRIALVGAIALLAGNLVSLTLDSFIPFLLARFLTGWFGDGLCYVSAVMVLGRYRSPVAAFGILSFSNMCFSGVALSLLPVLSESALREIVLGLLCLLGILCLLVWRRFPVLSTAALPTQGRPGSRLRILHLSAVAGLFAFTINLGAVWGYAERLGATIGLEIATVGQALSISIIFQAFGSLAAVAMAGRVDPRITLLLVACMQALGLGLQLMAYDEWTYMTGFAIWGASWNLGIANLLGLLSATDGGGRILSLAPGTEASGAAVGPMLVAALQPVGLAPSLALVAGIAMALSILVYMRIAAPTRTAATRHHL